MSPGPPSDPTSVAFWEEVWQRSRQGSFLKDSQRSHPGRWTQFYDQVAPVWDAMSGQGEENHRRMAHAVVQQGWAAPGQQVLEVGCGTGALARALAAQGIKVTALDSSRAMLARLQDKAGPELKDQLTAVHADWGQFQPRSRYSLALACFFPQAFKPDGLRRLESFSRGGCLLLLGDGRETFPLRRQIWLQVMDHPPQDQSFHLTCAFNYLLAAGRAPRLKRLAWPTRLDLSEEQVRFYFTRYFAIFGQEGTRVERALASVLEPHLSQGRVRLEGEFSLAALWWPSPSPAGPGRD
ncbi:MAG: methyltransferase domain-containing protein [Desulfarculaceae bacterium]|nr:methyltransferase domain-containing protein [Desulfarculaceae bacterium]